MFFVGRRIILYTFLLLCILMFCTGQAKAALVDGGSCGEDLTWTLDDKGALIINGTGKMDVSAPWAAFSDSIRSVQISDGVSEIAQNAFSGCASLEAVRIGNGVQTIGQSAFSNCSSLKELNLGKVLSIEAAAFKGCSALKALTIPEGTEALHAFCFEDCSALETVYMPSSLKTLDIGIFSNCDAIRRVDINDLAFWCGLSFTYSYSSPMKDGVTLYVNGEPLKELVIPEGVTSIGNYTFSNSTGLTSVTIPEGVTSIGEEAFKNCTGLTELTIPSSVEELKYGAFCGCSNLKELTLHEGLAVIGERAFENCNIPELVVPSTVYSIGNVAFGGCESMMRVVFPEGLRYLGSSSFSHCKNLTEIRIPNGMIKIGRACFQFCTGIRTLIIDEGLKTLTEDAFRGCYGLETVYLPRTLDLIESSVFCYCGKLTDVYYRGTETQWDNITKSWIENIKLTDAVKHFGYAPPGVSQAEITADQSSPGEPQTMTLTTQSEIEATVFLACYSSADGQLLTVESWELDAGAKDERSVTVNVGTCRRVFILARDDLRPLCPSIELNSNVLEAHPAP